MDNIHSIHKVESNDIEPKQKKQKGVSYAKWGYIFIIPFFVCYLAFTLYPQIKTIIYSFEKYYESGLRVIGPKWNGIQNYVKLFSKSENGVIMILRCFGNTMIMWLMGAIPQFLISLILAVFFTSSRLKLKCTGFFKSVFYMPNLIMAAAFAFLFYALFNTVGPINQLAQMMGWADQPIDFITTYPWSTRTLVASMNFLLWFGNTTILLMAGIMGIDESLFESARMDGASSRRVFFDITLPLLKPILVYVLITSMIGGLQMYDVPHLLTKGTGAPGFKTMTIVMLLNSYLSVNNYGMAGAVAVVLFLITGGLSFLVFRMIRRKED